MRKSTTIFSSFLAILVGSASIFFGIYLINDFYSNEKSINFQKDFSSLALYGLMILYGIWRMWRFFGSYHRSPD
jgi:hypothetical protein